MQNKKTIIIFSGSQNKDTSFAIKEYLMEEKSVLPIIIASEELNLALINIADDKLIGEASAANAIFDVIRKLKGSRGLCAVPQKSPEYNNDKTSHKKMRNIFKRYTPDVVMCLDARCLRAAIAVKTFLRADTRIVAYFSEFLPDRDFIYPETDVYFVYSEVIKSGLISLGIAKEKIIVNSSITRKRYLNEIDGEVAKGEFGLPKDKHTVLILANGYLNYKFSELVTKLNDMQKDYSYLVYCGYDRTLLKDLLKKNSVNVVARNEGMDMNLALSAADVVVARPFGEYFAAAAAKEKLFLSYAADTERQKRIAGTLSVDLCASAETVGGVADILTTYRKNPSVYMKQLSLTFKDSKEAGERLKDYLISML